MLGVGHKSCIGKVPFEIEDKIAIYATRELYLFQTDTLHIEGIEEDFEHFLNPMTPGKNKL